MESDAYLEFAEQERRHWWFQGRKAIFRQQISRTLAAGPDTNGRRPRILDLGCGTGLMLDELEGHGDTYGLDMAREAVRTCRSRGYPRIFRALGHHLPFPDGTLDLITAFDTIEHIREEQETLEECYRTLRPGGHLIISVPAYQWLYTVQDTMVHHERRYTARGLKRKLEARGFLPRKASYINFLLFPVILPIVLAIKVKQAFFKPTSDRYFSNLSIKVPRWANSVLAGIFGAERHVLRNVSAPAGHSLLVIAQKPPDTGRSA